MNEGKIDPFPTPVWFSVGGDSRGSVSFDYTSVFPAIFSIVFFIWLVYTIVVAYHWLRYGHRSFLAIPLLALHVMVSGALMLAATAGLH
jgi:hypothetical protein